MEDKIMCFVGVCLGVLCLSFAGMILTATITGIQPKQQIEMEIK